VLEHQSIAVAGTITVDGVAFDLTGTPGLMLSNSNATITVSKP